MKYAEYSEKDIVKHWGIKQDGEWLVDNSGVIIHFTCPRVANVQLDIVQGLYDDMNDNSELTVEEIK